MLKYRTRKGLALMDEKTVKESWWDKENLQDATVRETDILSEKEN